VEADDIVFPRARLPVLKMLDLEAGPELQRRTSSASSASCFNPFANKADAVRKVRGGR
jgi:hypothetical protein